jgi:hypothetical protein
VRVVLFDLGVGVDIQTNWSNRHLIPVPCQGARVGIKQDWERVRKNVNSRDAITGVKSLTL